MEKLLYEVLKEINTPNIILIILLLFSIAIKFKSVRNWLLIMFDKVFIINRSLHNHYLFTNVNVYSELIKTVKLKGEIRNYLFRTLLECKKNSIIRVSKEYLKYNLKGIEKESKIELSYSLISLIKKIISDYEDNILLKYVNEFGLLKGTEYFKKVYMSKNGFKEYHQINIVNIEIFLNNISNYEGISNKRIIFMFLGRMETALSIAIDDLQVVFKRYNGELEKIENIK